MVGAQRSLRRIVINESGLRIQRWEAPVRHHGDDVLERSVRHDPAARFEMWPVAASALEALVDLGMSDRSIGHYFHVTAEDVARLRRDWHITAS
jgi:hypothetical protein